MSVYKPAIVIVLTLVGAAVGVCFAEWRFDDENVLLAARLLLGLFGAMVLGFGSKWLLIRETSPR